MVDLRAEVNPRPVGHAEKFAELADSSAVAFVTTSWGCAVAGLVVAIFVQELIAGLAGSHRVVSSASRSGLHCQGGDTHWRRCPRGTFVAHRGSTR